MPSYQMLKNDVVYPPDHNYPLYITARQYRVAGHKPEEDALTLVLLHSTSFHKETWEPTVERIFDRLNNAQGGTATPKIAEVWTIEAPNHGRSAVLNEKALLHPEFHNNFSCLKYAQAAHRFLTAGTKQGAKIDFSKRNLVGIGHSLGGVTITILSNLLPRLPFSTLFVVEPMMSPSGVKHFEELRDFLVNAAYERRDTWRSKDAARKSFQDRTRTKNWHPKVLDLYLKYALRQHSTWDHPVSPYKGFTLCLTREEEAAMYRDTHCPTATVADLNKACAEIPVHLIFGASPDFIHKRVRDAIIDGRQFATITFIRDVGHLVPQEKPDQLGDRLFDLLGGSMDLQPEQLASTSRSRL